ncbi:MAG: hypothetical protein Q9170_007759 [Blastenia crenularia]
MPNEGYGNILARLSSTCTFPTEDELGDEENCHICLRSSLQAHGGEVPTKLGCGHVFGMSCLLNWVSSSINIAEGRTSPTCPVCRTPFMNAEASPPRSAEEIEREELSLLFSGLNVREVGTQTLSEPEQWWIGKAERLWTDFRKELVHSLYALYQLEGSSSDPLDLPAAVSCFELCQTLAEAFVSYDRAYNFYHAYCNQDDEFKQSLRLLKWWEGLHRIRGRRVPDGYARLVTHFDTADFRDLGTGFVRKWRVSRALKVPRDEDEDTNTDVVEEDDQRGLASFAEDMRDERTRFLNRVRRLRQV